MPHDEAAELRTAPSHCRGAPRSKSEPNMNKPDQNVVTGTAPDAQRERQLRLGEGQPPTATLSEGAPNLSELPNLHAAWSKAADALKTAAVRYTGALRNPVADESTPSAPVALVALQNAARAFDRAANAVDRFVTKCLIDRQPCSAPHDPLGVVLARGVATFLAAEQTNRWIDRQAIARIHWACDEIELLQRELAAVTGGQHRLSVGPGDLDPQHPVHAEP